MKFLVSQILASAALACLANATFNCATDLGGLSSVVTCVEAVTTCQTTITDLASISACECSYFKAVIACQSSICGDTYPTTSNGNFALSSEYCGATGATATAAASATATGSEAGATGSAASKTSQAGARAMITAFPEQAVLLAGAGLVGVFL